MSTVSSVIVAVLAVALLVSAFLLARARSAHPWAAIGTAALTSAICFTVGGESVVDTPGPSLGVTVGGIVGLLSLVAGVVALMPRSGQRPAPRTPILLAVGAIVVGAVALLFNLITT